MTTGKTKEIITENKRKYKEIKKIINIHKNKEILIMGDMNGHIGKLGEKIDKNGDSLINFAKENDLEIGNITKAAGKITWRRIGRKEKSAIDYILYDKKCGQKFKEIVIDENKEIDINTDHNMIVTKYKYTKQKVSKKEIKTKIKWKRKNVNWDQFREKINDLGEITGMNKEEIMTNMYKKLRRAGEKSVGYTRGIRKENQKSW